MAPLSLRLWARTLHSARIPVHFRRVDRLPGQRDRRPRRKTKHLSRQQWIVHAFMMAVRVRNEYSYDTHHSKG